MIASPAVRQDALAATRGKAGFPVDPDFPQLEVASDPARMLEVFRAHLERIAGKAYHIDACVPVRFRCRQSTSRCVLQYSLRVIDRVTGGAFDQWVTGILYARAGDAERLWRELGATDPKRSIPDRWLTFELLRYRPEIGAALRYTLELRDMESGRTQTRRCYVKVCRPGRGAATFQLMQALCAGHAGARSAYDIVRPLAYLDELDTLVVDEAPGTSLLDLLRGRDDPMPAVRAAARALAAFHLNGRAIGPREPLAEQIHDVERATSLLEWACAEVGDDIRAVAATIVADLTEAPPTPIHGDLKADHLFIAGDR